MRYKNVDDWFKWNCKGCANFFECKKLPKLDRATIPEYCKDRRAEW